MIGDALRSSLALATRLQAELSNWHRREGHSASFAARELARLILGIATQMHLEVEELLATHERGQVVELDEIVALNDRALHIETWLESLESTTHRALHPVLSPTVRAELEALGVSGRVLVAGVRDVSYEVLTFRRAHFAPLLTDAELDTFAWPFFVFRVPNEPLDWPLHHVLLYHEIGHALLGAKSGLPIISVPFEYDPAQSTNIKEQLHRAARAEMFRTASASWLEELYADAVGLCLAGPAYVIALARLLGTFFRLDKASSTHPPLALRIKLLVTALVELGFTNPLPNEAQSLVQGWAASAVAANNVVVAQSESVLSAILREVVRLVEQAHPHVLQLALRHVGSRKYTAVWFEEDWQRGRLLADLHIPPIEAAPIPSTDSAGVPLEPARVFSSCWAAYLQAPGRDAAAADRYAQAILGSLEGVEALRNWSAS